MREFGEHFQMIREQRAVLASYEAYELDFDAHQRPRIERARKLQALAIAAGVNVRVRIPETFAELHAGYHYNLDTAQSLLKIACSVGTPLDVSDRPVAHDIRLICDPVKLRVNLGDKQRARDVLMATDFYDECGHMPGVHVSKITVPIWVKPVEGMPTDMLVEAYENPTWRMVVVASFENAADAVLYKLTVA